MPNWCGSECRLAMKYNILQTVPAKHGAQAFRVRDKDGNARLFSKQGPGDDDGMSQTVDASACDYVRVFGDFEVSDLPSKAALCALGDAMVKSDRLSHDSTIPAGYTYFGQFIFHDITHLSDDGGHNLTSPALDLQSVLPKSDRLGIPRDGNKKEFLRIGTTWAEDPPIIPEDLPRETNGCDAGWPQIADPRNDNFLPLAQCHLLLMKFYNAVVSWYETNRSKVRYSGTDTDVIRRIWIEHFQWVVLMDYLPRLCDRGIHADVLKNKRKIVRIPRPDPQATATDAWMPLEFAGAIGRFGHSMIRDGYSNWNREQDTLVVTIDHFRRFSYFNSQDKLREFDYTIPRSWVTDWFRFFDFSRTGYGAICPKPIMASKIDIILAPLLKFLPESVRSLPGEPTSAEAGPCHGARPEGTFNLARETLLRGRHLMLAPAQRAVSLITESASDVTAAALSCCELVPSDNPDVKDVFRCYPELATKTPLWYYILREAEVRCGGDRLGPLASRVVIETLHAAIEASDVSILDGRNWKPFLPRSMPPGLPIQLKQVLFMFSTASWF
jgi:hypothetical protein